MQRARLLIPILFAISLHAQTAAAPNIVPISKEAHHHLVLENEYVRVYSVEVPPHSETLYHQHDLDYIFVTLGDSDVENVRVGEQPVRLQLKDGEVRFTKGGFAHKAVNNSDKPFKNVTIELKASFRGIASTFACNVSSSNIEGCSGFSGLSKDRSKEEGNWLKVFSANLAPDSTFGASSVPDSGLLIFLDSGEWTVSAQGNEGSAQLVSFPVGESMWASKNSGKLFTNAAKKRLRIVMLELPLAK